MDLGENVIADFLCSLGGPMIEIAGSAAGVRA